MTEVNTSATDAAMDPIYRVELLQMAERYLRGLRREEHHMAERLAARVANVQAAERLRDALKGAVGLKAFAPRLVASLLSPLHIALRPGEKLHHRLDALANDIAKSAEGHGPSAIVTAIREASPVDGEARG